MDVELARVLDLMPGMVFTVQPDGRIDFMNGRFRQLLGLEDPQHWSITPLFAPLQSSSLWKSLIDGRRPFNLVVTVRISGDQVRTLKLECNPSGTGDAIWYGLASETFEASMPCESSTSHKNETSRVLDSIPVGLGVLEVDGRISAINHHLSRYYGLSLEEIVDWQRHEVVHPDDAPALLVAVEGVVKGVPYDIEVRLRRADGQYRWFQVIGQPMTTNSGEILRWYALHIDIDDRKRAEDALRKSETELRLIVDGIAGLIAIFSPDAQLIGGNQQIIDYFDMPLSALNNWATNGITHPDDLQICIDSFMGSIKTGEPYDYETRFLRHDGTWRWFQLRGLPLRNPDGEIIRWYGLLTDIDDRKRAEEKLRRNEAFLADAQRLSKTGSFVFNLTNGDLVWSAETYRIFAVDPAETVTLETVLSRLHPDSVAVVNEVVEAARRGDRDFEYEVVLVAADQSLKHLRVLAHSETTRNGDQELTGAVQDITERRKSEEALNEARSELSYVTRVTSLGLLTASIAHEVNQPLAGMVVNSSTCLRVLGTEPPDLVVARDAARRMIRDANRAADVIGRLRELFSRKPPLIEDVDINELASEVLALLHTDLQRSRLTILTDFGAGLPCTEAARVQLQQVVMNLIRNSIEALSAVIDRQKRILVKTEASGGAVQLLVQDNGVGFGSHGTDRIFDAFYTTRPDGMGIGLSVSRSIIESHNGRMWAETNPGSGATVGFSIPVRQSRARTSGAPSDENLKPGTQGSAE